VILMRFPPSMLDEIRQRLPVSAVVGRRVKLRRQGREYAGLSPFKAEKTPSFTVNDQKGFYHCFSSGEHGDIFKFVMATEGLSFTEAVERLAKDAGVPLPKPEPRQREREEEFDRLRRVTEASAAFFQQQLQSGAGREAQEYLARRGVAETEIAAFRLGYAPEGRDKLKAHLAGLGFGAEECARAGMLIAGDDIPAPYDRFRHRLMFPITNLSGAVIAFGGRVLKPDQQPKYLNSPETPLFHKGSVLFNAHAARRAAHERREIIVAEGYMDVIALARAGFANAVAPLGTALTEDQLRLLWRMADEPVMCFDGDAAGRKAALRALETALPHLKPGATLRFAFLPDGLDPDDLLRASGPSAVVEVLKAARPLIEVLWSSELDVGASCTPEARQALRARLFAHAAKIQDKGLSAEYRRDLADRWWSHFNPPKSFGKNGAKPKTAGSGSRILQTALIQPAKFPPREAAMIMMIVNHPFLIEEAFEDIAELRFSVAPLARLRDAILEIHGSEGALDKGSLHNQLSKLGLGAVLSQVEQSITHQSDWHTRPDAHKESVLIGWRQMIALHRKAWLKVELEAATQAYNEDLSEENLLRLLDVHRHIIDAEGQEASIDGYAIATAARESV
jgi:DNA primase